MIFVDLGEIGRELLDKGGEGEEKEEAEVWLERGFKQFEARNFEASVASFDKAVEIKPDFPQAWYCVG